MYNNYKIFDFNFFQFCLQLYTLVHVLYSRKYECVHVPPYVPHMYVFIYYICS